MVNDLMVASPDKMIWKHVDDVSISKNLDRDTSSTLQPALDSVSLWASKNWMKLNAKKYKELQVCFFREKFRLAVLTIDGQAFEIVSSQLAQALYFREILNGVNISPQ